MRLALPQHTERFETEDEEGRTFWANDVDLVARQYEWEAWGLENSRLVRADAGVSDKYSVSGDVRRATRRSTPSLPRCATHRRRLNTDVQGVCRAVSVCIGGLDRGSSETLLLRGIYRRIRPARPTLGRTRLRRLSSAWKVVSWATTCAQLIARRSMGWASSPGPSRPTPPRATCWLVRVDGQPRMLTHLPIRCSEVHFRGPCIPRRPCSGHEFAVGITAHAAR